MIKRKQENFKTDLSYLNPLSLTSFNGANGDLTRLIWAQDLLQSDDVCKSQVTLFKEVQYYVKQF